MIDNLNQNNLETKEIPKEKESFWDLARFAIIAILIVLPIRMFIAQPFIVSGSSMVPTFSNGEYLIVDEISYRLHDPKRDDVIIFRYPVDTKKFFIKRIIGLPNETVKIEGSKVTIYNEEYKDGFVLEEPYVENTSENNLTVELKENEYFLMGDNRSASSDSRYWGPVKRDLIVGRAFLRLLPIKKLGVSPGSYERIIN